MDASQRRELTSGMHRSTGSYELVLGPVIFGLFGFWLDHVFGIAPVLTVLFAVMALGGVAVKLYYGYSTEMDEHEANLPHRVAARERQAQIESKGKEDLDG